MNTPYQWTKQVASHWGGTRNGTIVHWPKGIKAKGEIRIAVPPRHRRRTDDPRGGGAARAGLGQRRAAAADRGRQHAVLVQRRQGRGAARDAVFRDVRQPRHLPQGLDRGDAAQDAVGAHGREDPAFDDDVWELYDTSKDWSQANDLSKQMPEKLHELQRLWLIEATRYNVLPLDDRLARTAQPGHCRPAGADQGQIADSVRRHGAPVGELRPQHQEQVALGDRRDRGARNRAPRASSSPRAANIGGWSLYAKDGKLKYCYNVAGRAITTMSKSRERAAGGRAPGAHGVCLCRRRSRQGRPGDALCRRQEGRRRARSPMTAGDGLLRR